MITLRDKLLDSTLQEIKKKGYNKTSINDILKLAGGKKGSLYYYFKSKKALALAVIDEIILKDSLSEWESLEMVNKNYIKNLKKLLKNDSKRDFINGCILGTLIQETSSEKEFNKALAKIINGWQKVFITTLQKAKKAKEIRDNIDVEEVSIFLISILEGAMLVSKLQGCGTRYKQCINQMLYYLDTITVNNS